MRTTSNFSEPAGRLFDPPPVGHSLCPPCDWIAQGDGYDLCWKCGSERRSVVPRSPQNKKGGGDRVQHLPRTRRGTARMEAALVRLRDCDWVITPRDRMDAVRTIAREALGEEGSGNHHSTIAIIPNLFTVA